MNNSRFKSVHIIAFFLLAGLLFSCFLRNNYTAYQLRGKLIPIDKTAESIDFVVEDSGNKKWMPDQTIIEKYMVNLSQKPKGEYSLAIQLFDTKWETPVEIGLTTEIKVEDYFNVQNISF